MAISFSQKNEILPKLCGVMPVDLFKAAIKGDDDVLIHRLGLPPEVRDEIPVTIEAADIPDSQNTEPEHQTVIESELGSATRSGENFLHLLLAGRHNNLAMKIFSKDASLLKARNKKLETPLHYASRVGNEEAIRDLIRLAPSVIKDALGEKNKNGDTALHLAAKNHHGVMVAELMKLDPEAVHNNNKQGFSPWYIAILEGNTSVVKAMLDVNDDLTGTQFSDGTLPVHAAARMNCRELVEYFLKEYPNDALLLDHRGRNLFHFAAEQNSMCVVCGLTQVDVSHEINKMVDEMINARDYEGNTPLHIAEMKGHRCIMSDIWNKLNKDGKKLLPNQKGKKPNIYMIENRRSSKSLEINQVIGLGAVLITTLAFGAAFTIPGGYNAANGTPVLGRRYAFKAFVVANTLAFVQAFASVGYVVILDDPIFRSSNAFQYAEWLFASAARCMIAAFGLGSYVTLAGVSMPMAIIVLVVSLLTALPTGILLLWVLEKFFEWALKWTSSGTHFWVFLLAVTNLLIFMFIFCLAFL
ncbi:hypothetical protein LUZ63_009461 [Rhynchospora breviuscula]|uniref:PGG domain-containing protein n=1 Tax=Rhynchospora breviuscula TaxID=2022672 RepID=A0A9Q0CF68_9POAL|nr:hypothetical protein LUZ63_009461 [Rhynchospora breviuscula]